MTATTDVPATMVVTLNPISAKIITAANQKTTTVTALDASEPSAQIRWARRAAGMLVASTRACAGPNRVRGRSATARRTAWLIKRLTITRASTAAMIKKMIRSGANAATSAALLGNQSGMGTSVV